MTRKPIPCGHGFNVWTDFYFYPFLVSALVPPPLCGARVISCIIVALNLTTLASEGPLPTTYIPKQQSFVSAHISPFAANLQAQVVTCDGEKQIRWTYGCLFLGGFFLGGVHLGKQNSNWAEMLMGMFCFHQVFVEWCTSTFDGSRGMWSRSTRFLFFEDGDWIFDSTNERDWLCLRVSPRSHYLASSDRICKLTLLIMPCVSFTLSAVVINTLMNLQWGVVGLWMEDLRSVLEECDDWKPSVSFFFFLLHLEFFIIFFWCGERNGYFESLKLYELKYAC